MPRARSVTLAMYGKIVEIGRLRAAIPTDKELARDAGISPRGVQAIMERARKAGLIVVSPLSELDSIVAEVMRAHELRQDVPDEPLIRRPFKPRRRPNTAIISKAAKEAIAAREWAESPEDGE